MTPRLIAVVSGLWVLVAALWGAQTSLASGLQGDPVGLATAVRTSLINSLPWIPATLAVIWLATWRPVTRATWRRNLWLHVLALPLVAFLANALVVLGFWLSSGGLQGPASLIRQGATWAALRLHVAALFYVAIAGITQGVRTTVASRERQLRVARLETQLARARLEALNAQIRPHFLFNTIHTIGQLWRSGRADEADALLDRLGSLFQRVQSTSAEQEVPLSEELDMVREYLAIEEARFPDRLRVDIDVEDDALACGVPPLLLQPLVENAIRHGISRVSSAGRVRVEGRVDSGTLRLAVRDDGPGPGEASSNGGSGTGLSNTRARLTQMYGSAGRLVIVPDTPSGTVVRIELPAVRRGVIP